MGPNASEIRHAAQGAASALLIRRWFGTLVCYLRHGDRVFGTYWTSGRGVEAIVPSYGLLDMTVYGRQETWEDSPAGWPHWWETTGDQWRTDGRLTTQWSLLAAGRSDDQGLRLTRQPKPALSLVISTAAAVRAARQLAHGGRAPQDQERLDLARMATGSASNEP